MPFDVDFLAGISAGTIASILLHPIDLVKTRLQIQDGVLHKEFSGLRNAFVKTWTLEGIAGFYKGVIPSCWGNGLSWGLYMFFYERAKRRRLAAAPTTPTGTPTKLLPSEHMLSAWEGGTITCLITNPIWLIKTRLQLQLDAGEPRAYRGALDALKRIVHEEGVVGLYRGLVPALLLVSHGMIQFAVYEELKHILGNGHLYPSNIDSASVSLVPVSSSPVLSLSANFFAGAASKSIATLATYPYQVIRSRLQQRGTAPLQAIETQGGTAARGLAGLPAPPYSGFYDCAVKTARWVLYRAP